MAIKVVVKPELRTIADSFVAGAAGDYADNDVISNGKGADVDVLLVATNLLANASYTLDGVGINRYGHVITVTIVDTTPGIVAGTVRIVGTGLDGLALTEDLNIAAGAGTYTTTGVFMEVSSVSSIGVSVLGGAGDETISVGVSQKAEPLIFRNVVRYGGAGKIIGAMLSCEEDAVVATSELILFSARPTATELDDNDAYAGVGAADLPNALGSISFGALADVGTGGFIRATSPTAAAPLLVYSATRDIYGILVLRDAEANETAGMLVTVTLFIE